MTLEDRKKEWETYLQRLLQQREQVRDEINATVGALKTLDILIAESKDASAEPRTETPGA